MPECAICLKDIPAGGKFVLTGTEVVHRACALTGKQTIGWRNRQALADTNAKLGVLITSASTKAAEVRGLKVDLGVERSQRMALQHDLEVLNQANIAMARTLLEYQRELTEARRVVAPAPVPAASPPVTESSPVEDDASIRFSLLEL